MKNTLLYILFSSTLLLQATTYGQPYSIAQIEGARAGALTRAFSGINLLLQLSPYTNLWQQVIKSIQEFISTHLPEEINTVKKLENISNTLIHTLADNYRKNIDRATLNAAALNAIYKTIEPLNNDLRDLDKIINYLKITTPPVKDTKHAIYERLLLNTALFLKSMYEKTFSDYKKLVSSLEKEIK